MATTKQVIATKPGMSVAIKHEAAPVAPAQGAVVTAHPEPDGDEQEAVRCEEAAEAFQKMAEDSTESEAKGKFQKMSESFKKMGESKRQKMAESESARVAAEAAAGTEVDEDKEAEEEKESLREIATGTLMREAGLDDATSSFVRKMSVGKTLAERKKIIEAAKTDLMRESGEVLVPARQIVRGSSDQKFGTKLKSFLKVG